MRLRDIPRADLLWLAAMTVIAAAVRAASLQQPISYDEAYTFLNFVARGGSHLFEYPVPNNHVFHTLLARISTLVFGHHLWSMRLPAFIAGVAAVPAAFVLCRTLAGRGSGYLAATATALYPFLVMYSSLARGYSLVVLFSLLLTVTGLRILERRSALRCAAFSVVGALGLFTIPTMLFALAAVYFWLAAVVVVRGPDRRLTLAYFGLCAFVTAGLAALLYVPTVERAGMRALTANAFVQPLAWATFAGRLPAHYREVVRAFSWNVPALVFPASAVLMAIGMIDGVRRRDWPPVLLLPGLVAGAALLLVLKQSIPFARTWIFMIPFALVTADLGIAAILRSTRQAASIAFAASCLIAAAWTARGMIIAHTITDAADFPAGPALVQQLKQVMHEGDDVSVMLPIDWPAYYYLWYYRVPSLPARSGRDRTRFFIVDKRSYSLRDMTADPATLVADYPGAALYERVVSPDR